MRDILSLIRAMPKMRDHNIFDMEHIADVYARIGSDLTHKSSGAVLLEKLIASVPKGGSVLEVGTGVGLDSAELGRRRPDLQVVGTDYSEAMLDKARRLTAPDNVTWQHADACDLPFEEGMFDAVFSCLALKIFPDKRRGVAEMLRVVRPGGVVMVTEFSPWAPRKAYRNFIYRAPISRILKPLIVAVLRREVGQTIPSKSDVDAWFSAHPSALPFEGTSNMVHSSFGELPCWFARLERVQPT